MRRKRNQKSAEPRVGRGTATLPLMEVSAAVPPAVTRAYGVFMIDQITHFERLFIEVDHPDWLNSFGGSSS